MYNCFCSRHNIPNPGFETQEFKSNFIFEGAYFKEVKDFQFKKIGFEFYNSNKWLEFREGFKSTRNSEESTINLELGPSLNYLSKVNELTIKLDIFVNVNRNYQIYKIVASQIAVFSIELRRRTRFENIFELYLHLKNLVVLCTQLPILPKTIFLVTKKRGLKDSKKVSMYYAEKVEKETYIEENARIHGELIDGIAFQENFDTLITNWFKKREKFDFLLSNFFYGYYFDVFLSDKFLTNARLLESLHREFINGNRVYQAKRYNEILVKFKKHLKKALRIRSNIAWSNKVRDYRNKLTHNNRLVKSKALGIRDLDKITYESKILIVSQILAELGIPMNQIGEIVVDCFRRDVVRRKN